MRHAARERVRRFLQRTVDFRRYSRLLAGVAEREQALRDLPAMGLARPTATWTYVVRDNPFGTDMDRALRRLTRTRG